MIWCQVWLGFLGQEFWPHFFPDIDEPDAGTNCGTESGKESEQSSAPETSQSGSSSWTSDQPFGLKNSVALSDFKSMDFGNFFWKLFDWLNPILAIMPRIKHNVSWQHFSVEKSCFTQTNFFLANQNATGYILVLPPTLKDNLPTLHYKSFWRHLT